MRKLTETEEMVIFDLLEGNLSESQTQEWLKRIDADTALAQEYRQMKRTYLNHEDERVQVPAALWSQLNNTTKTSIIPMWVRAAAAVVAVVGLGVYTLNVLNTDNVGIEVAENKPTQVPANILVQPEAPVVLVPNLEENIEAEKVKLTTVKAHKKQAYSTVSNDKYYAAARAIGKENATKIAVTSQGADVKTASLLTTQNVEPELMNKPNEANKPTTIIVLASTPTSTVETNNNTPETRASMSWIEKSKQQLKRGKTPDINVNFDRKKLKFQFAINN